MRQNNLINNRNEAFMILGIQMDASEEMIKKQYKLLCKKYHPDQNKAPYAKNYYLQVQQAYQYLREHPYQNNYLQNANNGVYRNMQMPYYQNGNNVNRFYPYQMNMASQSRPAKIFSTDKSAETLHKRQVAFSEDKKRIENGGKDKSSEENMYANQLEKDKADPLKAIQTIWLAEQIHRQIEQDKIEKEKEQKRKLYKAFSQYNMNIQEEDQSE